MPAAELFGALGAHAYASIQALAIAVRDTTPVGTESWTFSTADVAPGHDELPSVANVRAWAATRSPFLYFFALTDPTDMDEVEREFSAAKARERSSRAYAKLNEPSQCLYVGSSRKLGRRFREHLGYCPSKTYALQLAHWARPLALKIKFVAASFASSTTPDVLQALEDSLWTHERPMFGRRGAR